jgi:excinuclease ABC subunit A
VVDIGPGAGEHGGAIVHAGTVKELLKNKESLTGQYLSGKKIEVPESRGPHNGRRLSIKGAGEQPASNIDVDFPLGVFVASPASRARASPRWSTTSCSAR